MVGFQCLLFWVLGFGFLFGFTFSVFCVFWLFALACCFGFGFEFSVEMNQAGGFVGTCLIVVYAGALDIVMFVWGA